jgi:hypothetical protein
MNLIDCSYFYVGPLQIMNAKPTDDLDNNAYAVDEAITAYIERYQDEFLNDMVGKDVADVVTDYLAHLEAYQQALEAAAEGEEPAPYVDESAEELCSKLRLPFAHYIYFKIVGDANQTMTITGLVTLKTANEYQSPRHRMVKVWNDMVRLNKDFIKWAETSVYDVFYHVNMITPINQYNL